jgi:spore coat protein U-like protein
MKPWLVVALLLLETMRCTGAYAATTCTVTEPNLPFGIYDPTTGKPNLLISSISTTCTYTGTGFYATLTLSTGSSGTYFYRTMVNNGNLLGYNITLDAGYSVTFGNGTAPSSYYTVCFTGGSFVCSGNTTKSGVAWTGPVYGVLPGGEDVPAGTYTDTIIATVTY